MKELSIDIKLGCYLSVLSDSRTTVILCVEPPGFVGFSVKLGTTNSVSTSGFGIIMYSSQKDATKREWCDKLRPALDKKEITQLINKAKRASRRGWHIENYQSISGLWCVLIPIVRNEIAVATLSIIDPILSNSNYNLRDVIRKAVSSARKISDSLDIYPI